MGTSIDQTIFHLINHTMHFGELNKFMPYYRSMYLWMPVYGFLAAYLLYNFGKKGLIFILFTTLTIGITDTLSSKIIKPLIKRERPCQDINFKSEVKLLVPCGSGYSFPSSHAANHFGLVTFLVLGFGIKNRLLISILFFWALSIGVAQIYVGLHYPSDVLAGAILGFMVGGFVGWIFNRFVNKEKFFQLTTNNL